MLAAAGADDPAATLRPLLTAALDNALEHGDAALTGPIVRGDVNTVRAHLADIAAQTPTTLPSYLALARATLSRAVTDGRVLPLRAMQITRALDAADTASAAGSRPMELDERLPHSRAPGPSSVELLAARRTAGERVGFVPTMGALHDGHASLIERGPRPRSGRGPVVVSVFVNPTAVRPRRGPRPLPPHPRRRPRGLRPRRASTWSSPRRSRRCTPAARGLTGRSRSTPVRSVTCSRAGPARATSAAC